MKKIFALLMSLTMTIAFMPMSVFAEGEGKEVDYDPFEPSSGEYMVEVFSTENGEVEISDNCINFANNEEGKQKATFTAKPEAGEGGTTASLTFKAIEGYYLDFVNVDFESDKEALGYFYDKENDVVKDADGQKCDDFNTTGDDVIYNITPQASEEKVYINAGFSNGEEEGDEYRTEFWIDGGSAEANVLPGDEFKLEAKLYRNDEEIWDDVEFNLITEENKAFDSEDAIIECIPDTEANGVWNCKALPVFGEDEVSLLEGNASFQVEAIIPGDGEDEEIVIPCDWGVSIGVGCKLDYGNENIMSTDQGAYLDIDMAKVDDHGIIIDPFCTSEKELNYDFEIGVYEDEEYVSRDEFGKNEDGVLILKKEDINNIIAGHDPGMEIRVLAKGTVDVDGEEKDAIYKCETISVDVEKESLNIFNECNLESPSSIKYVPGQKIYDVVNQFKLISKRTGKEVKAAENVYEWRFVKENPDELDTPEKGEAASVLKDGKLELDHMGKYWVVVAGTGEYDGFIIDSFELVDSDVFYTSKPKAIDNLTYNDGQPVQLVTTGAVNGNGTVKYKLDDEDQGTTVPSVTEPGTYKVSFRVVDENNEIIIPEESVNVRVGKKPVKIVLNRISKTYGTVDPGYSFEEVVQNKDEVPDSIKSEIKFSRERGEDVNGQGYLIYARCEDENYEAMVSYGRLLIEKANYHLSVAETVSFSGKSCEIPYYTDAGDENIEVKSASEDSKLKHTAEDGTLKIEAEESCSEDIELVVKDDDNHNGDVKMIHIERTSPLVNDGNGSSVETKSDSADLSELGVTEISVNPVQQPNSIKEMIMSIFETADEDEREEVNLKIELSNEDGPIESADFPEGTSIIVKLKVDDALESLYGGTDPVAQCDGENDARKAWFEYNGKEAYFCFETSHLSDWTLSAIPATDLNKIDGLFFNIPETVNAISNGDGYNDINLGEDVLRYGEGENDFVDPSCFKLTYARVDEPTPGPEPEDEEEFNLSSINEPGWYKVKADAVVGSGYLGSFTIPNAFEIVGEHEHDFDSGEWHHNNTSHWKECVADGDCGMIDAMESHNFEDKILDDNKNLASAATCIEYAKYYKTCECGAVSSETFSDKDGGLVGHDYQLVEEKPATYKEYGRKQHYECPNCGKCFLYEGDEYVECSVDDLIIPIVPHDHVWESTITKATFDKAGSIVEKCSLCGDVKTTAIPKATASLSKTSYTYNGKVQTPSVKVTGLVYGKDYKVTYAKGRKDVGTYSVVITLQGQKYSGSKTLSYVINPKGATIKAPKKAKKAFTAKWKKQSSKMSKSRITGYQVRYATKKDFSNAKMKTVKGYKKTSKKITKLKKKTKYYVQVRTYKKIGSKTYYSGWSKSKSVKTK